ncbi:hypothetical protein VTN77DRAFT_9560 [Rasamsonia byssochlamydoides]|uniref:uncharacterized protein n=1 Tax=Rasamsonia byssochlamydoides TaxID=89139 RepID=UPI00374476D8
MTILHHEQSLQQEEDGDQDRQQHDRNDEESSPSTGTLPHPKLRLHVQDLRHPASSAFLSLLPNVESVLETALAAIIEHLYTSPYLVTRAPLSPFTPTVPPTRSVTLVLRDFNGVAYTTGTELDDEHKEIRFSLSYIHSTCKGNANPVKELTGVLTHELVHCYQHTAPTGTTNAPQPPGGLIEGIADFVRLKADLVPPHWKRPSSAKERAARWDQGYQHTAFFLAWLEDVRIGRGAIGLLNDRLLRMGYTGGEEEKDKQETSFWKGLFGADVLELWEEYGRYLDSSSSSGNKPADWEEEIVNLN